MGLLVVALQFPGFYLADKWFAYALNNREKILTSLRDTYRKSIPSATSNTDNNETNTTPATANDESTNDGEGVSLVNDRDEGGNVDSYRADMIDNVNED